MKLPNQTKSNTLKILKSSTKPNAKVELHKENVYMIDIFVTVLTYNTNVKLNSALDQYVPMTFS